MRTTIDLPEELHGQLRRRALERRVSMSRLVTDLLEASLEGPTTNPTLSAPGPGGLRTVALGRPVTAADVAELEDEW